MTVPSDLRAKAERIIREPVFYGEPRDLLDAHLEVAFDVARSCLALLDRLEQLEAVAGVAQGIVDEAPQKEMGRLRAALAAVGGEGAEDA